MGPFPFRTELRRPIVVWSRGAADRAVENSLAAFGLAVADGADMIALDVRLSADGEAFVFRDARTGRTARENVLLARCAAARLRTVRLKNGEPVPRLADVLDLVGGAAPVVIEVRVPGGAAEAVRALEAVRYGGPVLLSSPLRPECLAARALRPDLPCGLTTGRPSLSDLVFCRHRGMASIHPDRRTLTVLRLRALRESGVPFLPCTVEEPAEALRLAGAGAAGVFSNRPAALRDALAEREGVGRSDAGPG